MTVMLKVIEPPLQRWVFYREACSLFWVFAGWGMLGKATEEIASRAFWHGTACRNLASAANKEAKQSR
jgi:hypothetical protein